MEGERGGRPKANYGDSGRLLTCMQRAMHQAMIMYCNAGGSVAGRRVLVKPVLMIRSTTPVFSSAALRAPMAVR